MKSPLLAALALPLVLAQSGLPPQAVPAPEHAAFDLATLREDARRGQRVWSPFLDRTTLQTGLYRLAAGATDGQGPHPQDEVYFVTGGRATLQVAGAEHPAEPGAILFVAAGVPHRFVDVTEDLEVLVFFSKAPPRQER